MPACVGSNPAAPGKKGKYKEFLMNDTKLAGTLRKEDFGSAGARRVLASGRIPAVIYGKIEPMHITVDAIDFQNKLRSISESTLLTIKVGRKNHLVLMKDIQENVLLGKVLHVDFYEVTKGEILRANVSIVLEGNPEGIKFGGVLEQIAYEVEVECLPQDLPRNIVVDVSHLGLNESIHMGAIELPPGVKALIPEDTTIASVVSIREEVLEPEVDETDLDEDGADEGAEDEDASSDDE